MTGGSLPENSTITSEEIIPGTKRPISTIGHNITIKDLAPEKARRYELPFGYELRATQGEYEPLGDDGLELLRTRCFDLLKAGEVVFSVKIPDEYNTPKYIYPYIEAYLKEVEGDEAAEWIRRKCIKEPIDTPPWERNKATRKIPVMNPSDVASSLNDDGNATRFEKECKDHLIYDYESKEWYAWLDNHWEPATDKLGKAERFVGNSIKEELHYWETELRKEQERGDDGDKKRIGELSRLISALREHSSRSMNQGRQKAMSEMSARSNMSIEMSKKTDVSILAFRNGAIDCKTGIFYPLWMCANLKNRYPMTYIDATYTEGARPSKFLQHIQRVCEDNQTPDLDEEERFIRGNKIGKYFLRLLGYLLYPGNPEQIFLFLWGKGSNGKSTTIDVLRKVLSGQLAEAPIKELYVSGEDRPASGITNGLSKRVLLFSEASDDENERKGGRVSRDTVKALAGDAQTARFRETYGKSVERDIICTPIGVTNELPRFDKELDYALLRRLVTIPFLHVFKGLERAKNKTAELLEERDSIFSLMIDELRAYLKEGLLEIPEECKATQTELLSGYEYNQFVITQYQKTDGKKVEDRTSREAIQNHYLIWCDDVGITPDTIMKIVGEDDYGNPRKKRTLSKAESGRLFNAFRVNGIEEMKSHGSRFFNCKLKS